MGKVAETLKVFEVQLAESLKHFESSLRRDCAKLLNEVTKVPKDSEVGTHHKVANYVAMMLKRLADVRYVNFCDAPESDSISSKDTFTADLAIVCEMRERHPLQKLTFHLVIVVLFLIIDFIGYFIQCLYLL